MAYHGGRGGGGGRGGEQHPACEGRRAPMGGCGGGHTPTGSAWPPLGPSNHGAYQQHVFGTPVPSTAPPAAPGAFRAPSPSPATARAPWPSPTASPAASPFQASPAPQSTVSVAKELFESETPMALPAVVAAASQVDQPAAEKAPPGVYLTLVCKKGLTHPARRGAGTATGKKVMIIRANQFLISLAGNNMFQYDVCISPELPSVSTDSKVLSELIKVTSLGGKSPAYDGRRLYTSGSLPFESREFVVTVVDPEKEVNERVEREYKITIRSAGSTNMYHLQQFLCGREIDMPQETIQVLDVVLRELASLNCIVSRSFFSAMFGHREDIAEGMECWRAYYQRLRPTQMRLLLNNDLSTMSLFKPVRVIKFLQEFLDLRDFSWPLTDRDRVKIKKALKDEFQRYKIAGITSIPPNQLRFMYLLAWYLLTYLEQPLSVSTVASQCLQQIDQSTHQLVLQNNNLEGKLAHDIGSKVYTNSSSIGSMIQVMVRILDFGSFPLPCDESCTIHDIICEAFHKQDIYILDPIIRFNGRTAYLDDKLSFLNTTNARDCSITINPRLRGGYPHPARSIAPVMMLLEQHVLLLGDELFDVVTFPQDLYFKGMDPYFISLGLAGSNIGILLFELLEVFHSQDECVSRFGLAQLLYDSTSNVLQFSNEVVRVGFSHTIYCLNMFDAGSALASIFMFDELRVLAGVSGIHIPPGVANPHWKLPRLVEFLIFDLHNVSTFPGGGMDKRKRAYFRQHTGVIPSAKRFLFWLSSELHFDYKGGEQEMDRFIGLQTMPNWKPQAMRSRPFAKVIQFRVYNGNLLGDQWSSGRNWLSHAKKKVAGGQVTMKQAEAFLHLLFECLFYYVLLKLTFPHITIHWGMRPIPAPRAWPQPPYLVPVFPGQQPLRVSNG